MEKEELEKLKQMMKDFITTRCICGREFSIPFHSMQENPPEAPSFEVIKHANEILTNELMYHQNKKRCHIKFSVIK